MEHYIGWGTPDDLLTFEYWQSCFHKWASHEYSLEADSRVAKDQLEGLHTRYQKSVPSLPEASGAQL